MPCMCGDSECPTCGPMQGTKVFMPERPPAKLLRHHELEEIRRRVEKDWQEHELWTECYEDFQALFAHIEAMDLNLGMPDWKERALKRKGEG